MIDDDKHFIHQLLSHGQVLSIDEVWYQMTIINVQANDYGIYICEGTNRLGTDRIEIKIYGLLSVFCSVLSAIRCPFMCPSFCRYYYYPYLTLPSGWAGCYTCPVLRPYQFGPMRNPDVTRRSQ